MAQERDELQQACDEGDAGSCITLAYQFEAGTPDADAQRVLELNERACELGSGDGCVKVAVKLTPLMSMMEPDTRSIALFEKGCELGAPSGCANAGIIYERGRSTSVDKTLALEIYEHGCSLGSRYLCQSAGRLKQVMLGRPSSRGAEQTAVTVFNATVGQTTVDQLLELHPVNLQRKIDCAGGALYSILGSKLDANQPGSVSFFFSEDDVLAGIFSKADIEAREEIQEQFDSRFARVPSEEAVSVGADPLWLHGDTEIMVYATSYDSMATIGYFDWGVRGGCTFGMLVQ